MNSSMTLIGAVFSIAATGAAANGDFWHPATDQVVFAANGGAVSVCSNHPVYPILPGSIRTEWTCYEHATFGAREGITVYLPRVGETRVIGARWAYATDADGVQVPMSKD